MKNKKEENIKSRSERHLIKPSDKCWKVIDEYSWRSKNLYNYANYIIRQEFINSTKENGKGNYLNYNAMDKLCQQSEPYRELESQASQQLLKILDKNWKSFFKSIKDYSVNPSKYKGRPKLPKYLDKTDGRFNLTLCNTQFKIIDNYVYFCWKPLKPLNNTFKSNIDISKNKLMQLRFVPQGNNYMMEIVYDFIIPQQSSESKRIASIDLGINNFVTITNNCGIKPIVINGKPIKSMNQYYNKETAIMQSELMLVNNKHWSNKLQEFSDKRNRKIDDFLHKASKYIVDWCVTNNIDTLVCGYNSGWKQDSDMGKVNNQKFVGIPYLSFKRKLEYKCENVGIKFIETKEEYTSGTSFLDGEEPTKENYNKSRRKCRGLFISNEGVEINADVNGSYQIMCKVFPNAFADGIEGVGLHPTVVTIS